MKTPEGNGKSSLDIFGKPLTPPKIKPIFSPFPRHLSDQEYAEYLATLGLSSSQIGYIDATNYRDQIEQLGINFDPDYKLVKS